MLFNINHISELLYVIKQKAMKGTMKEYFQNLNLKYTLIMLNQHKQ